MKNPSELKITDIRFADIDGAPKRCTLVKLYTNQEGLVGYGEVRDASSRTTASVNVSHPRPWWLPARPAATVSVAFRRSTPWSAHDMRLGIAGAAPGRGNSSDISFAMLRSEGGVRIPGGT